MKKLITVFLVSSAIICLFSCNKKKEILISEIGITSYEASVRLSENVYVGRIISVSEEPVNGFTYKMYGSDKENNVEMVKYKVKILEVLKGNYFEESIIEDKILYEYKDFLEKDKDYVFITCNNYSIDNFEFNINLQPFCAVKLQ